MSKTSKMIDKMERENMKTQDDNAKWLLKRFFENADDLRAMSAMSQDMNEFSEILDELVAKALTMNNSELHRISRVM